MNNQTFSSQYTSLLESAERLLYSGLKHLSDKQLEELYFMCYVETIERKQKEKDDVAK